MQRSGPSVLRLALAALVLAGMMGGVPALAGESVTRTVVPVGRAVGVKLFSDGVMVVGFSQVPAARGESIVTGLAHIDRGYEGLEEMLRALGANVERREA